MKKNDTADDPHCPTLEQLSAWYDGEEEAGVHLRSCSKCQKVIEEFTRIDDAVRRSIPEPDPAMITRIKQSCQIKNQPRAILFHLARVAAVIMIIIGLAGMFLQRTEPERTATSEHRQDNGLAGMDFDSMPGEYIVFLKNGNQLKPLYGPWITDRQPAGRIASHRNHHLVSLNGSAPRREPLAALLPQEIRHVWVVEDIPESRKKIIETLPEGSRFALRRETDEEALELTIWMEENKLQSLVDTLAEEYGWALVSSELPQPGQGSRLISQGREIRYNCTLIVR